MNEFAVGFTAYFSVIALIAFAAYRRTQNDFDYDIGGRSLSPPVTALSAGASDMSGWLLLGLPGAVYAAGLIESWIVVGLLIGAYLNWQFVAPRLRFLSGAYDEEVKTLPQLFRIRTGYSGLTLRLTASVVVIVFFTVYTSAGFVASAKLFQSILGWDYAFSVLVGVTVIMLYTVAGGFLAVSWTDAFQALLMLVALIALPILALSVSEAVVEFTPTQSTGFIATISLLAWGLGYCGQPHVLARFMAIKDPTKIGRAKIIGMSWMLAASVGAIAIGFVGIGLVPELDDPETVFIRVAETLLNPWVAGVLIAAILAAVMSTVDSQLIVASTAIVNDVMAVKKHKLLSSRAVVVAVTVVAGLVALDENSIILDVVAYAWAGLGASFGPALLFCLFWKRTTGEGVIAGILTGALTTIIWQNLGSHYGGFFEEIYEIIPAFLLACIAIVTTSHVGDRSQAETHGSVLDRFTDSSSGVP